MTPIAHASPLSAVIVVFCVLAVGGYLVAVLDRAASCLIAGRELSSDVLLDPMRSAAWRLSQQTVRTERPDAPIVAIAPAIYLTLAAAGLVIVPMSEGFVGADLPTGVVVWGTIEALIIVAVFFHGWGPNSPFAMVAGFRFIAVGLSYGLISMFILIGASLPAESLSISAIVDSQASLWNVIRQPLGLPLFLLVALGATMRGPFDVIDSRDLAGGSSVESSGVDHLLWSAGRHAALTSFAVIGSALFLGGWHGPLLPGSVWMLLKSVFLLVVLVAASHAAAGVPPRRLITLLWLGALPASFLALAEAGLVAL